MGKQSRRKRGPRPARQFRNAILAEAIDELIRSRPDVDWKAIHDIPCGLSVLYGGSDMEPELRDPMPWALFHPGIEDQMEFDRRVCEAGLTDYLRDVMPGDKGVGCIPLDPETMKPDPSIVRPDMDLGKHLRVTQLAPGLRVKRLWRIAMLTGGNAGYVSP